MRQSFDFEIKNCSSIVLFNLLTAGARDWVAENVSTEPWQWMGTSTLSIEHRYATQLASTMVEEGFNLKFDN